MPLSKTVRSGAVVLVASCMTIAGILVVSELRTAQVEIDLILDEGVVGLDRAEDLLQSLLDLRAGVLSTLIPASESDRLAIAAQLSERLTTLDRQNDRLAELKFENLLHDDEGRALKGLIDVAEVSVREIIDEIRSPGGDIVISPRDAMAVSTQIDECASEVHSLSTCVSARARVADSRIPNALSTAQNLTFLLAGGTLVLALLGLVRIVKPSGTRSADDRQPSRIAASPAERLRIVHVLSHTDATRGGAIQALLLARRQRADGHDVLVLANSRTPRASIHPTFQAWIDEGIPLRFVALGDPQGIWCSLRQVMRLRRVLRQTEPEIIHVHRDKALLCTLAATVGIDVPVIVAQRGTTRTFRHPLIALAYRSARVHRIIAVAQAVKVALCEQGVDRQKVDVVYGSFDVGRFDPAHVDKTALRRELDIPADAIVVAAVGELNPRKDPETLLAAFAEVRRQRPDVHFVHAGDAKKVRRKAIEELGRTLCGDRLRFLGWRRDVPEILAAADVIVNASVDDEGLTGTVREALAMARPMVCTATDGNPELVIDRVTGLLVPPRDVNSMAAAIVALIDDPALGRTLGAEGRRRVLATMTLDVRAPAVEQIYRDVLVRRFMQV